MILKTELKEHRVNVEDAVFIIQELGTTALTEIAVVAVDNRAASLKAAFIRTVKGWENVVDENGKDIPCNEETKEMIFEANREISEKVLAGLPNVDLEQEDEKKI